MTLQQRTPLKRTSELKRTPIKRKKVMPSALATLSPGLEVTGAVKVAPKKRKPKPKGPTKTQYKAWCDQLFSLCVRASGPCMAQGWRPPVDEAALLDLLDLPLWLVSDRLEEITRDECLGNKQCAHIVSRGYLGTRWDFENAVVLCAGDHVYFTHHPLEWELWVNLTLGVGYYDSIRRRALGFIARQEKPDYPATFARLIERADELGIPTEKFKKHLPSNH